MRLGFGHVEVGTITPLPQDGNPKPRVFRLVEDRAVINRYGFNGKGMAAAAQNLQSRQLDAGVVGVNIGANKTSEDPIADYRRAVAALAGWRITSPLIFRRQHRGCVIYKQQSIYSP